MKFLLGTSLGHWDQTWFDDGKGNRVSDERALELIKKECNKYETGSEGYVVYMSKQEFENFSVNTKR
jgi:hypothetical protein